MLHALVIVLPFRNEHYKPQRKRVLSVLVIRAMLFTTLLWLSLRAFLLYPLAYILFLIVLRFMDANQHSYDLVEMHDDTPSPGSDLRDSEYEYRNTYSNLISTRIPLLNLITLNFAYHNAHHARPTVAWYRLPGLHRELYGDDRSHILSFRALLGAYHKHRVARAFWPVAKNLNTQTSQSLDLLGIVGISFLIPV